MAEAGRVGSYKLNICLVLKMTLPGQVPIQRMIANTPGFALKYAPIKRAIGCTGK
jgi:hypothetical protein